MNVAERLLKIGLVMNPIAGIGGPAALKGSDGPDTVLKARQAGSESKVLERTRLVLQELDGLKKSDDSDLARRARRAVFRSHDTMQRGAPWMIGQRPGQHDEAIAAQRGAVNDDQILAKA